tara:strand:- start:181 stop:933 length:753 start_codon:yes stop_codon:yes gene_type:complete
MAEVTLSYSPGVKGWPSFYSFIPDYIQGMNNYLYTFKNGQLYRHNTNSLRNNFYGVQYNTTIKSVFNKGPLDTKLFKTLTLESDSPWSATLATDLPQTGSISSTFFEKKEGNYFAFIRFLETDINLLMRYANGIANVDTVDATTPSATTLAFGSSVDIGSIISIGDMIYYGSTPTLAGEVKAITNQIIKIDTTISGGSAPSNGDFILYVKNTVAESHGVLGHYCEYELTNTSTSKVELFSVSSETMKSFP